MTSTFVFAQYVNLCFECSVRVNASWFSKNLSTLDLITCNTTEQSTDVIAGLCFVQLFVEHFKTSQYGFASWFDTNEHFSFRLYKVVEKISCKFKHFLKNCW